jgi:hypothetical protein
VLLLLLFATLGGVVFVGVGERLPPPPLPLLLTGVLAGTCGGLVFGASERRRGVDDMPADGGGSVATMTTEQLIVETGGEAPPIQKKASDVMSDVAVSGAAHSWSDEWTTSSLRTTVVVAQRRRWGKRTYIYVIECCVALILGILAQQVKRP